MTFTLPPSLRERAMLVRLHIRLPTFKKDDKRIAGQTAKAHGANVEMVRFAHSTFAASATRALKLAEGHLRDFHKKETRPWLAGGVDILAAASYWTYTERMGELLGDYNDKAKPAFIKGLDSFRREARSLRGDFYKAEDYPSPEELQETIVASLHFMPLPAAEDFRAAVSAEEVEKLRRSIEEDLAGSMKDGLRSLWTDLYETIDEMARRLARYEIGPDGKVEKTFRDSAITNVRELVERIGRLNVTADSELESMCQRVRQRLVADEPELLRTDERRRAAALGEAQSIMQAMAGFLGPARKDAA